MAVLSGLINLESEEQGVVRVESLLEDLRDPEAGSSTLTEES
jgi:hypothetical protein